MIEVRHDQIETISFDVEPKKQTKQFDKFLSKKLSNNDGLKVYKSGNISQPATKNTLAAAGLKDKIYEGLVRKSTTQNSKDQNQPMTNEESYVDDIEFVDPEAQKINHILKKGSPTKSVKFVSCKAHTYSTSSICSSTKQLRTKPAVKLLFQTCTRAQSQTRS